MSATLGARPCFGNWIGGRAADPDGGDWIETIDPSTATPWAEIGRGGASDVAHAVAAAQAAYREWRLTPPSRRAALLWAVGDILAAHGDELAELECRDNGKVFHETSPKMIAYRDMFHYYASCAYQLEGRQITNDRPGLLTYTTREPYGVIASIPAFNSPISLTVMLLAPALAAGNTLVVKPPEIASPAIVRLAELCTVAGLPAGCFNVVLGYGHEAGDALVAHPDVRKVFFTGSVDTARAIATTAARGIKPCVFELGGKSANIVFDDARDLDKVAASAAFSVFNGAGQVCIAGTRRELFAPVLSVIPFSSEEEAIALANDSSFGLGASVWTTGIARAHRAATQLESGSVWVNTTRTMTHNVPFGGRKLSGYGRENGADGLLEFTQSKSVWIDVEA